MATDVGNPPEKDNIHIIVYKNGDPHFRGKKVFVNKKKKNFHNLCDDLTDLVKPISAIRNIATPNHGHRIHDVAALEDGKEYVAMSNNSFVKNDYSGGPKKPVAASPREIKPVSHSSMYRDKSAAYNRQPVTGVNFRVYDAADPLSRGTVMNLKEQERKRGWEKIFEQISNNLGKKVFGLHTLDGQLVTDINSLGQQKEYVAVGRLEHFKEGCVYGVSPSSSRNTSRIVFYEPINYYSRQPTSNFGKREPLPPIKKGAGRSEKSSAEPPAGGTEKRKPPARKPAVPPAGGGARKRREKQPPREEEEEEDVFHAKPVKHTPNGRKNKSRDTDRDEEKGPFRAKEESKETKGAKEVQETAETKTAYTIDQVEAEEVQDEEIQRGEDRPEEEEDAREETPREPEQKPANSRKGSRAAPKNSAGRDRSPRQGDHRTPAQSRPATVERRKESPTLPAQTSTPPKTPETQQNQQDTGDGRREAAAVKIQSGYRGYQARVRVQGLREERALTAEQEKQTEEVKEENKEERENKEDPAEDEHKEQENDEQKEEEQKEEEKVEDREKEEEKQMDEDEAATRIQASFKGYKVRQDMEAEQRESQGESQGESQEATAREDQGETQEETPGESQDDKEEGKPQEEDPKPRGETPAKSRPTTANQEEARPGSTNQNEDRPGTASRPGSQNENQQKDEQTAAENDSDQRPNSKNEADSKTDNPEERANSKNENKDERANSKNEGEDRPGSKNSRRGSGGPGKDQ